MNTPDEQHAIAELSARATAAHPLLRFVFQPEWLRSPKFAERAYHIRCGGEGLDGGFSMQGWPSLDAARAEFDEALVWSAEYAAERAAEDAESERKRRGGRPAASPNTETEIEDSEKMRKHINTEVDNLRNDITALQGKLEGIATEVEEWMEEKSERWHATEAGEEWGDFKDNLDEYISALDELPEA